MDYSLLTIHYSPFTIKNLQACKPDSVSPGDLIPDQLSFIWPRHYCRGLSAYPPSASFRTRTSRPQSLVYLAFQHVRFTLPDSYLPDPWALTPHFHHYPSPGWKAVIFCGTISFRRNGSRPLAGTLLCAVRTFLPRISGYPKILKR